MLLNTLLVLLFLHVGQPCMHTAGPHSPHMGQHYMWVTQSFASFALSVGGAAPHVCGAVHHYLRTVPGGNSPACMYYGIMLAPYSLQAWNPLVYTAQWVHKAAPHSTHWINLQVEVLFVCTYGTCCFCWI